MQFKTIFVTLAAVATMASAMPTGDSHKGQCSTGTAQCCSQVHSGKDAKDALAGLGLAFNDLLEGTIGLDCQQIPVGVLGVAAAVQNTCKNTAVCCEGTANNGLVQTSCTPLSIN